MVAPPHGVDFSFLFNDTREREVNAFDQSWGVLLVRKQLVLVALVLVQDSKQQKG